MCAKQKVVLSQHHDKDHRPQSSAGAFDDGFQHRLDVGRRGRDHAEDVGAADLVSERLSERSRVL